MMQVIVLFMAEISRLSSGHMIIEKVNSKADNKGLEECQGKDSIRGRKAKVEKAVMNVPPVR